MAAILSQELPIMGYSGFPVTTVNEMRYIEAKECGLTALMQSFTTAADARRCLDMAQKTGIKLLLSNHIIFQKDGREIAKAVKGHHSNLAYGAQGLWYYNYRKGPVPPAKMFSQGHPIAPDGRRSTVYERMRRVNNEFQDRAFVFMGAKVDKVSPRFIQMNSGLIQVWQKSFRLPKLRVVVDGGSCTFAKFRCSCHLDGTWRFSP